MLKKMPNNPQIAYIYYCQSNTNHIFDDNGPRIRNRDPNTHYFLVLENISQRIKECDHNSGYIPIS
jgi:hypothetical protein